MKPLVYVSTGLGPLENRAIPLATSPRTIAIINLMPGLNMSVHGGVIYPTLCRAACCTLWSGRTSARRHPQDVHRQWLGVEESPQRVAAVAVALRTRDVGHVELANQISEDGGAVTGHCSLIFFVRGLPSMFTVPANAARAYFFFSNSMKAGGAVPGSALSVVSTCPRSPPSSEYKLPSCWSRAMNSPVAASKTFPFSSE